MSSSQENLHSENFDLCRICLMEPESNRHVKFINIFNNEDINLNQHVLELLEIRVDKDDIKPKFICENCHTSLMNWIEMKKKAAESQIVINYIAKEKVSGTSPKTNQTVSNQSDHSFNQENNGETSKKRRSSTTLKTASKIPKNYVNNFNIQNNPYGPGCSSLGDFSRSINESTIVIESDDDITCQEVSGTSPKTNQTVSNQSDHSFNQENNGETSKKRRSSTTLKTASKIPKNYVNNFNIQNNPYGPGCSSLGDFSRSINESTIVIESDDDITCQEVSGTSPKTNQTVSNQSDHSFNQENNGETSKKRRSSTTLKTASKIHKNYVNNFNIQNNPYGPGCSSRGDFSRSINESTIVIESDDDITCQEVSGTSPKTNQTVSNQSDHSFNQENNGETSKKRRSSTTLKTASKIHKNYVNNFNIQNNPYGPGCSSRGDFSRSINESTIVIESDDDITCQEVSGTSPKTNQTVSNQSDHSFNQENNGETSKKRRSSTTLKTASKIHKNYVNNFNIQNNPYGPGCSSRGDFSRSINESTIVIESDDDITCQEVSGTSPKTNQTVSNQSDHSFNQENNGETSKKRRSSTTLKTASKIHKNYVNNFNIQNNPYGPGCSSRGDFSRSINESTIVIESDDDITCQEVSGTSPKTNQTVSNQSDHSFNQENNGETSKKRRSSTTLKTASKIHKNYVNNFNIQNNPYGPGCSSRGDFSRSINESTIVIESDDDITCQEVSGTSPKTNQTVSNQSDHSFNQENNGETSKKRRSSTTLKTASKIHKNYVNNFNIQNNPYGPGCSSRGDFSRSINESTIVIESDDDITCQEVSGTSPKTNQTVSNQSDHSFNQENNGETSKKRRSSTTLKTASKIHKNYVNNFNIQNNPYGPGCSSRGDFSRSINESTIVIESDDDITCQEVSGTSPKTNQTVSNQSDHSFNQENNGETSKKRRSSTTLKTASKIHKNYVNNFNIQNNPYGPGCSSRGDFSRSINESTIVIESDDDITCQEVSGTSPKTNQTVSNQSDHSFNQENNGETSKKRRSSTTLKTASKIHKNYVNNFNIQNNPYGPGCSSRGDFSRSINESTIVIESDDDITCQEVSVDIEVVNLSESEESFDKIVKRKLLNNEKRDELHYCSICRKKPYSNHDCSQNNKEFSTCLVPCCNILFRSMGDFRPHYRQHIGMPAGAILCRFCFKKIKKSERNINEFHTHCNTVNLFKCYLCHFMFKSMGEFAYHKLRHHNGRLINSTGNYLCFHCEKSSPDLMMMTEHTKVCLANQIKNQNNVIENHMQPEEPESTVNTN